MYQQLKNKYYRWKARFTLVRRYEYVNEVNKVLEEYLTMKILQGGDAEFLNKGRKDLTTKQAEIKENDRFIQFLKRLR
jgi:hypothetical protein